MERSNPLPPGTYWVDVIDEPHQIEFAAWTFENSPSVFIEKTEFFPAVRWPDCPITEGECSPSRVWAKFRTSKSLDWKATSLGYPNVIEAGDAVNSSQDTASIPDFSDNCDIGCQAQKVAVSAAVVLGATALFILIAKSS